MIGKSICPGFFRMIFDYSVYAEYTNNKKELMTLVLFKEWLMKFNIVVSELGQLLTGMPEKEWTSMFT